MVVGVVIVVMIDVSGTDDFTMDGAVVGVVAYVV